MAKAALRVLVAIVVGYVAIVAILWFFQDRFLYPAPQVTAPLTPGYELVQLSTEDGLELRAFYRPAAQGLPTAIYFHGNGGTLSAASISNAGLAEAGIGVLMVEYRGYGGNPGEPSERGFYLDGEAAMQWLAARRIPADQTVIVGNSIGSGTATEMALRYQPAALVLIAPFTSAPDVAKERLGWLPVDLLMRDRFDNQAKIDDLEIPILVQHGTRDNVVPYAHGQSLAETAPSAQFMSFDGSGHGLSFEARSQQARRDWILTLFGQS